MFILPAEIKLPVVYTAGCVVVHSEKLCCSGSWVFSALEVFTIAIPLQRPYSEFWSWLVSLLYIWICCNFCCMLTHWWEKVSLARQIYLELFHELFFFPLFWQPEFLGYKRTADKFLISVVRINFLEAVGGKKKEDYLICPYFWSRNKGVRKQYLKPKMN